ncbi:TRAP transporter fused permease subunit [Pararhodobacter sp. SW119]|uniref:TRAP transporter permease n=1 Tax=Pararhodobacter sp. SW119 TaxID=2780075 RepID=UPI001AE0082B|nr:TRAP transporter fused permease subunit [Pararhodobacter sp. SW119]
MAERDPRPSPGTSEADQAAALAAANEAIAAELRRRILPEPFRTIVAVTTAAGVLLSVNQLFNLQLIGFALLDPQYLYILSLLFLFITFLTFPAWKTAPMDRVPWYDLVLALASIVVVGYFVANSERALMRGWEYGAPQTAFYFSVAFWLLILEGARRTGGMIIFVVVLLFSIYPTVADRVPGPIQGFSSSFYDTVVFHVISSESALGIPMRSFGQLVIGFILFGATLQFTGGGRFFNDLAFALVGRFRGGAGKVAIFASGFMGSMSGSVISNVMTTGTVTIPAMKKSGFSAKYAAGTEACASTGGVLMPPVMGATAFIMASFLGRPYAEIVLAAAIPSILFYFGIFVQLDAYAGRKGLKGMPKDELPTVRATLKEGWPYIVVFAVLIYFMMFRRQETIAPFYATALLLAINQLFPSTRFSVKGFVDLFVNVGRSLAELVALLLGVGLVVGAFSATGLAGTLVNDLVFLAGNEALPLLLMGAVTAFIFGMGMTVTACYIFLAVVLAPALIRVGLDPLAVHLFILYWGMVSFITPPVALGAFAAATVAGTSPMGAAVASMRLGSVIYIIPFFFVLNPALIGQGSIAEVATVFCTAIVGIYFIGSALQGYITGIGAMHAGLAGFALRFSLFIGGLFFASPGAIGLGLTHTHMSLIGLLVGLPSIALTWMANRTRAASP